MYLQTLRRFQRSATLWLVLASLPLLLAMGGGSEGPVRIPELNQDFKVVLVDQQGVTTALTSFALNGSSFVMGQVGKAKVAIPLEKVKSLELSYTEGKLMDCRVLLADGKTVRLKLKPTLAATGKTSYGNFSINLREVSKITFSH